MIRTSLLLLTALPLIACRKLPPPPPAYPETSEICDNEGIESTYLRYKSRFRDLYSTVETDNSQSLSRRLRDYDAEVDGQYRNVTSSCKAYSRCMQMNGYIEANCQDTLARWEKSEQNFMNLSIVLRELETEVEKLRAGSGYSHRQVNKCEDGICY